MQRSGTVLTSGISSHAHATGLAGTSLRHKQRASRLFVDSIAPGSSDRLNFEEPFSRFYAPRAANNHPNSRNPQAGSVCIVVWGGGVCRNFGITIIHGDQTVGWAC